jgi:septal ring factor EnvC (AmiA/AmiB activator)
MSKTYDKIREFQKRHQKPKVSPIASEETCNKYVSDLLSKKGSVSAEGKEQKEPALVNTVSVGQGLKSKVFLIVSILIILAQALFLSHMLREARSERIQVLRRLNSVEKELASSKQQLQSVEKALKDSELKFLTVSRKLEVSETRAKTLEKQLNEQKVKILSLTAVAQASSQKQ